jgi:hypothetical protein
MSDWITDRLPKRDDVEAIYDFVWAIREDGEMIMSHWSNIVEGQPWQVFRKPAPYVNPTRWTVEWNTEWSTWSINDSHRKARFDFVLRGLNIDQGDVAQRIEDLFNEVMP